MVQKIFIDASAIFFARQEEFKKTAVLYMIWALYAKFRNSIQCEQAKVDEKKYGKIAKNSKTLNFPSTMQLFIT